MAEKTGVVAKRDEGRTIIGISLPPAIANKVRAEVKRRNTKVNKLFLEMWELYEAQNAKR